MLPAAPRRSAPFRCILGPWFKETFHRHLADKLVGKATGVTVWVVKEPSPDFVKIAYTHSKRRDARHDIHHRCSRFRAVVSGAVGRIRGDHLASARHASLSAHAGFLSI